MRLLFAAFSLFSATISAAQCAEIRVSRITETLSLVSVTGQFQLGDENAFLAATMSVDRALITFSSAGGNLHAGLEIGRIIRARRYSTTVSEGQRCASACALAWLGGVARYMSASSRIGFHAASENDRGVAVTSGTGNALVGSYLARLGLSDRAVRYITQAGPYEMEWLDIRQARLHGIDVDAFTQPAAAPQVPSTRERAPSPNVAAPPAPSVARPGTRPVDPTQAVPPAAIVPASAPTPVCPPAGTVWTTSGGTRTSLGADPTAPDICLYRSPSGQPRRLIYNFHAVGGVSDSTVSRGMAPLFPLSLGKSADFIFVGRTERMDEFQYREQFQVSSESVVQIGSEQRAAWVVHRVQQGLGNNNFRGEETYWIDKITGVYLRLFVGETQGRTTSRNFQVINLSGPMP